MMTSCVTLNDARLCARSPLCVLIVCIFFLIPVLCMFSKFYILIRKILFYLIVFLFFVYYKKSLIYRVSPFTSATTLVHVLYKQICAE